MARTMRRVRCGVCGALSRPSLHRHTLAAALRGADEGPADLEWSHDGYKHVIAGGSALPLFAALVARLSA